MANTFQILRFVFLFVCSYALTCASYAQDYEIKAIPPNFTRDQSTTFLLDLTSPKNTADYATGSPAIAVNQNGFKPSGVYQGTIGIATNQNINPQKWTIEMLMSVPYSSSSNSAIDIGAWSTPNASSTLRLDSGWGPRIVSMTWPSGSYFIIQPYSGGNGRSLQASAPDKWVYVTFGADYANQKASVITRDTLGNLLNKDINFLGGSSIDTSFLSSFPADQQAAELLRRWQLLGNNLTNGFPSTINLGSDLVQIKAIKISNTYRSELFDAQAQLPVDSATVWTPTRIDPSRTTTSISSRKIGYPGYNNFVTKNISESKLTLIPGSAPISIQLSNMPIGVYSFMIYGAIDPKGRTTLDRVWQPTPLSFKATDSSGKVLDQGKLLLKQSFIPRRMQGFHFHVDTPTDITATFTLPSEAKETVWLQYISLVDHLSDLPDAAIKKSQNLGIGPSNQLTTLTAARKTKDDAIWAALPPLNQHLQVHAQVSQFRTPPTEVSLDTWVNKAWNGLPVYRYPEHTFDAVNFLNLSTNETFSTENIYSGKPWPSSPSDDGTGLFFTKNTYPSLATDIYNSKRAELLGAQYLLYAGALMNSRGAFYGLDLGSKYFTTGDPEIGHDGAMALVRWAHDWPALEMSLHELRLSTHSPDFEFNTDWSDGSRRNGKMYYDGWSGSSANWLFETYDKLFPYIKDNQIFADEVHRFIPWVNTPSDVIRYLDRYLVLSSVKDSKSGLIDGESNVQANAADLLGPDPLTHDLFDLTHEITNIYPSNGGTYQELYANALSRSGVYYIASFMVYAFGDAQNTVHRAYLQKKAHDAGIPLKMNLSDIVHYRKVKGAGDFLLNMWVAGGFPFMVGDASGGTHSGLEAVRRLTMSSQAIKESFELFKDARFAWILKNYLGDTTPSVVQAAQGAKDPILHAESRVVPDYGAIVETGEAETDVTKKTAMTLRLGIGQGHAHHDYLDLNLFGMGLPLAVDLACRNEGTNWSRPSAGWSFLHNHALAHDSVDPNGAGNQSGEPWLRSFSPPLVQGSYVDDLGTTRLDRDASLIQVGTTGTYYGVDIQRITGKAYHTWAFHGAESNSLSLNVPMTAQSVRWIDRTLEGTQYTGTATDKLQATWTMTRTGSSYPFTFNGGGTIQTVGAEPTALGDKYNASLPPVNVRATLLGQSGASVLQGNPYSKSYAYAFPFLWVQKPASGTSVFPALYEWYRGASSVINSAQVVSWSPLTINVILQNGQNDVIESRDDGGLSIVSKDAQGVLWSKFVGVTNSSLNGVSVTMAPNYQATITDINYWERTLTTSAPLPRDPYIIAGNNGRKIYLQLTGVGTSFTWDDDLIIQEGAITDLRVLTPNTISLTSNQSVLFAGAGNRKKESFTTTNEDGTWHFRNNVVIKHPAGVDLSTAVFTDANNDGFINVKTYEIGIGDSVTVPVETTIRRNGPGFDIKTNVNGSGDIGSWHYTINAGSSWQSPSGYIRSPRGPTNLKITTP
jgi:hypothetical protein